MLYADDTILLAESAEDLQVQLNAFGEYCDNWKIMVFGKLRQNLKFTYENVDIEIVKQFNYLGVIFTKTCNFDVTKKHPADKALKAMYEVLKMGRLYKLSEKIKLDVFDKMIKPILLHGCKVWGFGKNEVLERVHLKFYKILLNLKSSTPNYMVYGELGRYPIDIDIKVRTISYWARPLSDKQAKFSNVFYRLSRNWNENGDTNLNWVYFIRTNECGFTYIWETENVNDKEWLKCVVKQRLLDHLYRIGKHLCQILQKH
jgi:hypothetical protein